MTEQGTARVLCMEDDPGLARLLQRKLERAGYRVDLIPDGDEGLRVYDPDLHDVLVVDQQMPTCTGLEVMRALAARGPLPPTIMVTGMGTEQVAVEAMRLGAADYLIKDVEGRYLDLLPAAVERIVRHQRLAAEKAAADEALRQYAEELEQRNREMDAFAHTVAHDLRNPLTLMLGYASILQSSYASLLNDLGQECLQAITRSAEKMASIIDALLLLSKVRRDEVDVEPLPMGDIVDVALERLAPVIAESGAQVVAARDWPEALGYGPWVEEIWVNYISNALKYGGRPEEGLEPRVELGFDAHGAQLRFWVRDNGPGLTAEEQSQLFQEFARLDRSRAPGHGLGLSIVRRIVSKLGGEVGVESDKGQGSTFSFTLPRSDAPPSPSCLGHPSGEELA